MLNCQMWRNSYLNNIYKLIHTVHMLFFTFNISPKKLSVSGGYCNVSSKTYTKMISISILKYSTLYTRPTLHCSIYSVKPHLPYTLLMRALLSLVMYGFCSNKTLYSASFSFAMFIGSAAVAQWVLLKGSIHPSFSPGIFLELDH